MSEATTVTAATVEAALQEAAANMGIDAAELDYEVVEEKKDFWGLDGDTVVVKAWPRAATPEPAPEPEPVEAPEEAEEVVASAGQEPSEPEEDEEMVAGADQEPSEPEEDEEGLAEAEELGGDEEPAVLESAPEEATTTERGAPAEAAADQAQEDVDPAAIAELLEQIFHDMEVDCAVEIEAGEEGYDATVTGADKELLLESNGRALSALELLVNNAFRHKLEKGHKVRVDAGDFRSRREDELADLAYQVAHAAKESGRTQETQPLNPYERRLVHLALAEDPGVTTRSRGSGFLKNVQIIPRRESRGRRG